MNEGWNVNWGLIGLWVVLGVISAYCLGVISAYFLMECPLQENNEYKELVASKGTLYTSPECYELVGTTNCWASESQELYSCNSRVDSCKRALDAFVEQVGFDSDKFDAQKYCDYYMWDLKKE